VCEYSYTIFEYLRILKLSKQKKNENKNKITYINAEGTEIGEMDSDIRRIILVHSEEQINNIIKSSKKNENFDVTNLSSDQYFELPPYEIRVEIQNLIEKAYPKKDLNKWSIVNYEIGGQIEKFQEMDFMTVLNEGYVNRSWFDGDEIKSNADRAFITKKVDDRRDPFIGKDINRQGIMWEWHTHPNVYWNKKGVMSTYQRYKMDSMTDFSTNFVSGIFYGEKGFGPSDADYESIPSRSTGIVFDMKNDSVYFYNRNRITIKTGFNVFFNMR
jgi:hypothetical protein